MRKYKVLAVNPVKTSHYNGLDSYFFGDNTKKLEVTVVNVADVQEDFYEHVNKNTIREVIKTVFQFKAGQDAIMLNCFADPGLDFLRRKLKVPIFGAGESSIKHACSLGKRFILVDVGKEDRDFVLEAYYERLIDKYSNKLKSKIYYRIIKEDIDFRSDYSHILNQLKRIYRHYGRSSSDLIIIGCTAFSPIIPDLVSRLNFSLLNPGLTLIKEVENFFLTKNFKHGEFK